MYALSINHRKIQILPAVDIGAQALLCPANWIRAARLLFESSMKDRLERRKHPSYPLRWDVSIITGQGRVLQIYHGRTLSISLRGAYILCNENLSAKVIDAVTLRFDTARQSGGRFLHVETVGRILYTTSYSDIGGSRLRVEFTATSNEFRSLLSSLGSYKACLIAV